eukprot:1138654-Prorocentrum_minimum.AAC.1
MLPALPMYSKPKKRRGFHQTAEPGGVGLQQAALIRKYCDPRVVSVVGPEIEGDRRTTEALLQQTFDVAFFTGSPTVGRVVAEACGRNLVPCTLELGGERYQDCILQ